MRRLSRPSRTTKVGFLGIEEDFPPTSARSTREAAFDEDSHPSTAGHQPVDWNISKMKRDMRQLQAQLRELKDRNSTLENKQSRPLEQTDILEGHLNKASREQSDLLNENNRLIYELDQLKRDHEETERDLRQARNKLVWQQKELEALREANAKPNVDDL